MHTSIRVQSDTRDALAAVAAEHGESLEQALARLIQEHRAVDEVDRIDAWYASMSPEEQAITAALEAADRAETIE